MIQGQLAYDHNGNKISHSQTQTQIRQQWENIQKRYLVRIKNFGLLIRKKDRNAFDIEVKAFESILKSWVEGFRKEVEKDEENLVGQITNVIMKRLESMPKTEERQPKSDDIKETIRNGLQHIRVIDPSVKVIPKNIALESTSDEEFLNALQKALPPEDLEGWFEVFTAAPEKQSH